MNAFVKKEVRLLLPNFIFALALALGNLLFRQDPQSSFAGWANAVWYFMGCIACPAMAVMLALNTFGVEVGTQTFSMMLAQPVSRLRIWQTKILFLWLALLALGVVWCISIIIPALFFHWSVAVNNLWLALTTVALFGLVIFSGALWTVLLLRQVAAAFWFTLIVPGALVAFVAGLFSGSSDEFIIGLMASVLGIYSLAGFFFARWLFFRAQDLQWTGGTIVMPEWRGLARFKTDGTLRRWRPQAALWRKEILLHQSQFVIAFAILVLHLGVLALRSHYNEQNNRDLRFFLDAFWGLWLVMPLLVGSTAVAEERKLGVHECQLTLPVSSRRQFAIKFLVVLGLSLLLGLFMPLLLEGSRILPSTKLSLGGLTTLWRDQAPFFYSCLNLLNGDLPLLTMAGMVMLIGAVSFYISTMARNTLQTLAPAVLGIMFPFFLIVGAMVPWNQAYDLLWRGPVVYFIALPIMVCTVLALAFRNYRQSRIGWSTAWRNFLGIIAALLLGIISTSAVYHRFWEKLTPFEPAHGTAKLTLSKPVSLDTTSRTVLARLPDGKIWTAPLEADPASLKPVPYTLGNFKIRLAASDYLAGSNWLVATPFLQGLAGIKTDGTLWIEDRLTSRQQPSESSPDHQASLSSLTQLGSETNWTSFIPFGHSLLLTKSDGTLWRWGVNDFRSTKPWPGLGAFSPQRLGQESNWAEVFMESYQRFFRKAEGSLWATGEWVTNNVDPIEIEPDLVVHAAPSLEQVRDHSTALISYGLQFLVGICTDGTFRILADQRLNMGPYSGNYLWAPADLPLGTGTNWLAVAGNWEKIVTLRNDGSLWLWDFHRQPFRRWDPADFESDILKTVPKRLGTHSDWVAITGDYSRVTSLAADGSLWFWPLADATEAGAAVGLHFNDDNSSEKLLPLVDISRKPQRLGNIFDRAD